MHRRISHRLAALGAALCLTALSSFAYADQIYLTIEAQNQGVLRGSSTQKGWEGKIAAVKYAFQAAMAPTVAGGMGKRQYSPVRVTKLVDASSPQLLQALITGELLRRVNIDFLAVQANGAPVVARNVVLREARVISVDQSTEIDPAGGVRIVEEVSFSFTRIEMTDTAGRTSVIDEIPPKS